MKPMRPAEARESCGRHASVRLIPCGGRHSGRGPSTLRTLGGWTQAPSGHGACVHSLRTRCQRKPPPTMALDREPDALSALVAPPCLAKQQDACVDRGAHYHQTPSAEPLSSKHATPSADTIRPLSLAGARP